MDERVPAAQTTAKPGAPKSRQELILSIVGASILLVALGAIIAFALGRTGRGGVAGPNPTQEVAPTSTSAASPLATPSCETVINSGNLEVSVAAPVSTTIKDTRFRVEPLIPDGGTWSYPSDRSDVAVWLCGTVINYIIGLEQTPETEALITDLVPGDRIRLELANGTVLPFRFAGRQEVSPGDEDVLDQRQPRLTLLVAGGDVWHVATADYVTEEESREAARSVPSARLGQPVRVGDTRVMVDRGHAERKDGLPSGTMYYLVEFSVENVGDERLATSGFWMRLQDDLGNTYLVSPSATQAGEYGPLNGEMDPGASAQATAGYLVPDPLPAGTVIWSFSPGPGTAAAARIGIPYEGAAQGSSSVADTEVTVDDAFLDDEGDAVIIVGTVRHSGAEPLTVETVDVTLSSSSGPSELIRAAPPFPWSIEPGQEQVIELEYERPDASSALLELLGYSFEIGGFE